MKLEDLAYKIAAETLALLEKKYHYRIAEDHKKDVQATVRATLNRLLQDQESKKS